MNTIVTKEPHSKTHIGQIYPVLLVQILFGKNKIVRKIIIKQTLKVQDLIKLYSNWPHKYLNKGLATLELFRQHKGKFYIYNLKIRAVYNIVYIQLKKNQIIRLRKAILGEEGPSVARP